MSLYIGEYVDNLDRRCPICNGNVAKKMCNISYVLPEGNLLPEKYEVVCCTKCGFAYANVDADQNVYNEYYTNYNMYSENAQLKLSGQRRSEEMQLNLRLIQQVVPNDATILDVGCGSGEMLNVLKEEGFQNIWGMDPSAASISKVREKGINGFVGNIFDDKTFSDTLQFDLVISTAVIEHIYDLHGYLRNIKKYLKEEKSYVMLNAPAIERIDEYIWPLANHFNHEHINYFSKISLDNLLKTEGFSPSVETSYYEEDNEKGVTGLYTLTDILQADSLQFDFISQKAIKNYLLKYDEMDVETIIKTVMETNQSIIIWGVGSFAMQLLGNYKELLGRVKYFIDNNSTKHGELICGKEICSPEKLSNEAGASILICSIKNSNEIREQIVKQGWGMKNTIISFGD